jgi:hypothetical protein
VWTGDPCWATEQKNWAADLDRHVPVSFEFVLEDGALEVSDGWVRGKVSMAWAMEEGARSRTVEFSARFAQDAERGTWLYAGEAWNVLEGDKVRVLYADDLEEPARIVADVMPEVRARVHEGFELTEDDLVDRVQVVKLYGSMRHLQQSIYLSYTEPLGGWNEPAESIKLMARGVGRPSGAQTLLGHEYGHVATFELGPDAPKAPWWVLEGVAELAAEGVTGRGRADGMVRGWARDGELMAWDRLADFRGEAREHTMHVYRQGHHMLGFISDTYGRTKRNNWLRAMANGATLDDATRQELGIPFEQLDKLWRRSLSAESR